MQQSSNFAPRNISLSDAAIDGLFAGAVAGLVMAVYLTVTALLERGRVR